MHSNVFAIPIQGMRRQVSLGLAGQLKLPDECSWPMRDPLILSSDLNMPACMYVDSV